ncbi:MAG: elongation factor P [SAR202 cluster bacterium]|jgi:elongation factor P|nr:elongation factor P [Chloroflexota bacterium]MDP6419732.1 elongation factor P [SAR202 cluster bacterium]HAL46120.1 elongation factor P [Dehalococcoidia bacterium]MDP6663932.1 elongation factor P [SAR202 cluster bacterium]MDP6798904.1 elongation factor P [SAR202 cluster bacterium]|tara:strand:- start:2392 stop:2955 length:564 start_codon:yes stop_codon:yes gene_type:complete
MTIGYGDLRKGMAIELDGQPHVVVDYERSKMQQRAPTMRIRFRDIKSGRVVDRSFSGYDVKLTLAAVERRRAQYIYDEDGLYYFMDTESFDQVPLSSDQISDALPYLVEQLEVDLIFHQDLPIAIEIPINVDLKVTDSPPGLRGDTATGATKPATLETGLQLQVPLFVNEGETIKVDTRTGQYQSRV